MTKPAKIICSRCTMVFHVMGKPPKCSGARCPDCGRNFWHGDSHHDEGVRCGVDPDRDQGFTLSMPRKRPKHTQDHTIVVTKPMPVRQPQFPEGAVVDEVG